MIKSSIEKLAKEIGYDIGVSDDVVQSDLINGFCEAISNSMDNHTRDTQICCIIDKLSKKSTNVIKAMYEFIELKETDEE